MDFLGRFINLETRMAFRARNVRHSSFGEAQEVKCAAKTFETLYSRITSCYACVRTSKKHQTNAIVPFFFMVPDCIPETREWFAKADFLFRERANRCISFEILAFKSDDCVQGDRSPS